MYWDMMDMISESMYDYNNNKFGFTKGDLSTIKAKGTVPKGAGPYKFVSYENGTVTMEANENYFDGCPKIKYVLFKETSSADMLTGISTGTYDLTADASFNKDAVTTMHIDTDESQAAGNPKVGEIVR